MHSLSLVQNLTLFYSALQLVFRCKLTVTELSQSPNLRQTHTGRQKEPGKGIIAKQPPTQKDTQLPITSACPSQAALFISSALCGHTGERERSWLRPSHINTIKAGETLPQEPINSRPSCLPHCSNDDNLSLVALAVPLLLTHAWNYLLYLTVSHQTSLVSMNPAPTRWRWECGIS